MARQTTSGLRGRNAAASLFSIGRRLDEALFRLAADCSPEAVQEALIAVGEVACEIGRRPKLRESVPPLPRLSNAWVTAANPKKQFTRIRARRGDPRASTLPPMRVKAHYFRFPFRRHLVTLDVRANAKGWDLDAWDDTTNSQVLAVWTGRNLLRDMTAVLERRLVEAARTPTFCERTILFSQRASTARLTHGAARIRRRIPGGTNGR